MNPNYFMLRDGKIVYWDLAALDVDLSPRSQPNELKEDLAQISYGDKVVLDIGWYPSFDAEGQFRVLVTVDQDWESPIFSEDCDTWLRLKEVVSRGVKVAMAGEIGSGTSSRGRG